MVSGWEAQLGEEDAEGAGTLLPPGADEARSLQVEHLWRARGSQRQRYGVATVAKAAALLLAFVAACVACRGLGALSSRSASGKELEAQDVSVWAEDNRSSSNTSSNTTAMPTAYPEDGTCGEPWGECLQSRCCVDARQRCFKKNDEYAQCRTYCTLGLNEDESDTFYWSAWSCEKWDKTEESNCASDGHEDCSLSRCCKTKGHFCFQKDDAWAACNLTCQEGAVSKYDPVDQRQPWRCTVL